MSYQEIFSHIFSIFKGFLLFPWWFYLLFFIAIALPIFNRVVLNQRKNPKVRGKSDFEIFFENIFFLLFQKPKIEKSSIEDVDGMGGSGFERFLGYLFQKMGYRVNHVGTNYYDHRGDFGADLIVEKDGVKTAIQAKRYNNSVGIDAVREVLGAMNYYNCRKAIVVTNNYFTNDAIIQAQSSNIELWNRDKLIEIIIRARTPYAKRKV